MTEVAEQVAALNARIDKLIRVLPDRLNREDVCYRLGIHRNTLTRWIKEKRFPAPGPDGRWPVAVIMDWDRR